MHNKIYLIILCKCTIQSRIYLIILCKFTIKSRIYLIILCKCTIKSRIYLIILCKCTIKSVLKWDYNMRLLAPCSSQCFLTIVSYLPHVKEPVMKGRMSCKDTFPGILRRPLKTGFAVCIYLFHEHLHFKVLSLFLCLIRVCLQGIKIWLTSSYMNRTHMNINTKSSIFLVFAWIAWHSPLIVKFVFINCDIYI